MEVFFIRRQPFFSFFYNVSILINPSFPDSHKHSDMLSLCFSCNS